MCNSYLDRNALANARVLDIEKDLNLTGSDFNTCISVFFAGYLTLQIPSNLLLTRVRPSIYLVSALPTSLYSLMRGIDMLLLPCLTLF